jgi:predicted GH43/DUF377 family glycosyl hydrolase
MNPMHPPRRARLRRAVRALRSAEGEGREYSVGMQWVREGEVFPRPSVGDPDSARAFRPWVIEEGTGVLRMWYSGHDGMTWRILEAAKKVDEPWKRLGVAVDAGFSGETDDYGVESPCVVITPGGYLMAYGGSDGEVTRLHMATSADGRRWVPQGTFMQRGREDALAATDPCLLISGPQWWLYYSGYSRSRRGRRASILGAVSPSGASWDRIGRVLDPAPEEAAVSHPCVLDLSGTYYMFHASDDGTRSAIAMATSPDGVSWARRGVALAPSGAGPDGLSVHAPCVVMSHGGLARMWYAGLPVGDATLAYRICFARFPGPWPM